MRYEPFLKGSLMASATEETRTAWDLHRGAETRARSRVGSVASLLLSIAFFYPFVVSRITSPRIAILAFATVLLVITFDYERPVRARALTISGVVLLFVFGVTLGSFMANRAGDGLVSTNLQRAIVMTPVLLILGYRLYGRELARVFARRYVVVASCTALLAVVERYRGASLFGRDKTFSAMMREGDTRALLASEHSLVLGALFAVAVPLTLVAVSRRWRFAVVLLLLLGAGATGSRSPLALGVVFGVIVLFPIILRGLQRVSGLLLLCAWLCVPLLAFLAANVWSTTQVLGAEGSDYSANYRWTIYALLPEFLIARPTGFGMGTFPRGVWLVDSEVFGVKDVLSTLDSELVYSGVSLGWVGIMTVVGAFILAVACFRYSRSAGLVSTIVSLIGFTLALHAWDTLGAVWLIVTGTACAAVWRGRSARLRSARKYGQGLFSDRTLSERSRLELEFSENVKPIAGSDT